MTIAERDDAPSLVKHDPLDATLVDVRADDADDIAEDDDSAELERYADAWNPARNAVERYLDRPLPSLHQVRASVAWWVLTARALAPHIAWRALPALLAQIRPTVRGIGRLLQAWAVWRCKSDWLVDVKQAEGNERAKQRRYFERRKRARSIMSVLGLVALVAALMVGSSLYPWPTTLAVLAALAALDVWGHRVAGAGEHTSVLPSAPLREGAPMRMIVAQVIDVLTGRGHVPTVVNPEIGRYGVIMDLHTGTEVDDKDLEALERGLQAFPGAVTRIQSRDNAAVGQLRIMWEDPLAQILPPPRRDPLSCTIDNPGDLGYGLGAVPLHLNFLRTNILVVGGPGSGKSSCFWCMIDYLTACKDVVLDGIDLSGAATLDAWGECIRNLATSEREAEEVLRDALDLSDKRTRKIAGRSRPRRGGGKVGPENFGTADGKAHVLLIDELPLLAKSKLLLPLYSEHQRIGRKAASTSVAATQDLQGDTIGATSVRKYPSTTVLLACSREDVTSALGGGKVKEGWCPHRLVPAEGDDANDAGKAFIHSGRHRVPNPWRFNRLDDINAIHERALARIDAGMPTMDDDESDIIEGFVLPDELAIFSAAFTAHGWPEFLPTDEILTHCAAARGSAPNAKRLAELAADHRFGPDGKRRRFGDHPHPRSGYTSDAVRAAIARLERGAA